MTVLDVFEAKWFRRVKAAKNKWIEMVKKARTLEEYCEGIAAVTGLPVAVVRASFPARNYEEFQKNAEKFVDIWINNIERAFKEHKWSENYKTAFSIRAGEV